MQDRANSDTDRVPEPPRAEPLTGDLVHHTFGYDGGRQVTVYVPLEPPELIVYAGDGQLISQWGGYLEAASVPATMIVGIHRTDDADEAARLAEYSPSFDPGRFEAHEGFFVDAVRSWVGNRFGLTLPADRTVVGGVSASAELALAVGLRHPNIYGSVFAASPGGGYRPPPVLPGPLPRAYLVAGTLEPWFAENARRWTDALRDAGGDVVMAERAGDHGDPFWQAEFLTMLAWAVVR